MPGSAGFFRNFERDSRPFGKPAGVCEDKVRNTCAARPQRRLHPMTTNEAQSRLPYAVADLVCGRFPRTSDCGCRRRRVWFRPLLLNRGRRVGEPAPREDRRRAQPAPASGAGSRLRDQGLVAVSRARLDRPRGDVRVRAAGRSAHAGRRRRRGGDDHAVPRLRGPGVLRRTGQAAGTTTCTPRSRCAAATSKRSASAKISSSNLCGNRVSLWLPRSLPVNANGPSISVCSARLSLFH